jgi:hypothetical protein
MATCYEEDIAVVIDCELYLEEASFTPTSIPERIALLDEAGINIAVLMPRITFKPGNKWLATTIAGNERFVACCCVNPHFGDEAIKEFETSVKEWGMKMLKFMPPRHGYRVTERFLAPFLRKCVELKIPITVHSGAEGCLPLEIATIADEFPSLPLVMDHMGYRNHTADAIIAARKHKNIFLATTAVLESGTIRNVVDAVGAGQVVFGSNGPSVNPWVAVQAIKKAKLKPADEVKVMGENLAAILGIA